MFCAIRPKACKYFIEQWTPIHLVRVLGSHKGSLTFVRFRWVTLQLHCLCRIKVASLVEKRLGKLPQDLWKIYHETYTERFDEYREEETAIAQSALRWLICSQVPLNTERFLALASSSAYQQPTVSISRDDLLDLCFNFVVHDAGLDVFRFSHLSVREYLESTEHYQFGSCHAFAAEYCLRTLTSDLGINQTHLNDDDPGVDRYVCIYWPHHLKQSGVQRHLEPLKTLFRAFTMEQNSTFSDFSQWNEILSLLQDEIHDSGQYSRENLVISFPSDPLFVACVWGFEELLHWRVNIDTRSLDVQNQFGMTALHVICRFGNLETARIMVEKGVDLEATVNGRTALEFAIRYRHTPLVQLLVDKVARSELEEVHHFGLYFAITDNCTDMAHKLLDLGASPNKLFSHDYCCAFHVAVEKGQALVVEKMLGKMRVGQVEKNEWLARTQLMAAVIEMAEVTALFQQDGFGSLLDQETLQAALWGSYGNMDVKTAKVLIDAGADVNIGHSYPIDRQILSKAHAFRPMRNNMLHNTMRWEWSMWVKRHNVRMATGYGFGNLLLKEAVTWSSRDNFVELLLDSGALIDPPTFQGQLTPLEAAIRADREDYVNILIERGARIDRTDYELATGATDVFLGSLLDLAESRGHVGIARILSTRGAPSAVRRLTNQQYEEFKKESVYELE